MKRGLQHFVLLFLATVSFAKMSSAQETAEAWITKMNDAYSKAQSIQFSFTADYYGTPEKLTVLSSTSGSVYSNSEGDYHSDALGQIVLVNRKYTLIVDKAGKTITCLPGRDKASGKNQPAVSVNPDTAWLQATTMRLLNTTGATRTIELTSATDMYEKTVLTINAQTYTLERIVYHYKALQNGSKPVFEVKYQNVKLNESIPGSKFSEKQYIDRKAGNIAPAPAWNKYRIIDLTDNKEN
jgi:outer membrane lipoprotein-sorting protein